MSFSWLEILQGMASAAIYGGIFAIIVSLLKGCALVIKDLSSALRSVFLYKGSAFDTSDLKASSGSDATFADGEITRLLLVIIFTIGFSVAAFIGLDGEIRIYNLIISLCCFFSLKTILGASAERFLLIVLNVLLRIAVPALRLVFYPFKAVFALLRKKSKKLSNYEDIHSFLP